MTFGGEVRARTMDSLEAAATATKKRTARPLIPATVRFLEHS
jgi:hypothetical protein